MKTKMMFAVFAMVFSTVALAIPGIPHAFYGTATINGAPAPDGTVISARIAGVEVASTTTSGGQYGYPIGDFYIPDPDNDRTGDTITFYVSTAYSGIFTFANAEVTELNFAVTISTPTTTPSGNGGGGGSGGGGGGGGGAAPTTTTTTTTIAPSGNGATTTTVACQEKWACSDWSSCEDGLQTRTCSDENNCGTEDKKPFESQPCSAREAADKSVSLTGMLISTISDPLVAVIIIIVIAVILYIILRTRKQKPSGYKYKGKKN